jgi:hypothetical protein
VAKLRQAKKLGKGSPVRRFKMLSLSEISDLASHMQDVCRSSGPQLRALIGELLNSDSHRAALARKQSCAFDAAVQIDGQFKAGGKSPLGAANWQGASEAIPAKLRDGGGKTDS